jgi:hypothetical protein
MLAPCSRYLTHSRRHAGIATAEIQVSGAAKIEDNQAIWT